MKDYFFLAFSNLRRRKLRSWLTMIGIFIGIAAVVGLISIGQGLQGAVEEQFEQLGSDTIIIMPGGMGMGSFTSSSGSLGLTTRDLEFIEKIRGVDYASGYLTKQGRVLFKEESHIGYILGITEDDFEKMLDMTGLEVIDGRRLKRGDVSKVVVGYSHVYDDYVWENSLEVGRDLVIEGQEFEVIGVVEKIGNYPDDTSVYIMKDALREILGVEDEESQIIVKTASGFDPIEVAEEIEEELAKFRGEKEGQETFSVQTSEELLESFSSIFSVVQAVLVGIAAISLLVGGVGIMNTMYTSVLERTKEIGTMKAVGAKNSNILTLFLFESGLLGLIGGTIGVLLGIALSKGAEYIAVAALGTDLLQAHTGVGLIIGALLFSFLIGTLSGILPAMQAAKLKPADALRYE